MTDITEEEFQKRLIKLQQGWNRVKKPKKTAMVVYQEKLSNHLKNNGYQAFVEYKYNDSVIADVLSIENDKYIEYEFKSDKVDYLKDFSKTIYLFDTKGYVNKHYAIKSGLTMINQFYFVSFEKLLKTNDIPDHCGLMHIKNDSHFEIVKEAPVLLSICK